MSNVAASNPIDVESTPCMSCGGAERTHLWTGAEHEYPDTTDREFSVVRCTACGLARLDPRPAVSELGRIYPADYYAYRLIGDDLSEPRGLGNRIKRMVYERSLLRTLRSSGLTDTDGEIVLLDVGCGDGRLLDWYKRTSIGSRLVTHGSELNEDAAEIARRRGHHVVGGRFEEADGFEPSTYDVITSRHVIEHVEQPAGFMQRVSELLKPGGVAIISTPNIDSAEVRRFRGAWGGNHFPRHWTFFDAASIRLVAEGVGLEVVSVGYELNPVFWNWTAHAWLKRRFPTATWPDKLFPPVGIFFPSARSFVLLSGFTVIDMLQRAVTRRTASMVVELRKPRPSGMAS